MTTYQQHRIRTASKFLSAWVPEDIYSEFAARCRADGISITKAVQQLLRSKLDEKSPEQFSAPG